MNSYKSENWHIRIEEGIVLLDFLAEIITYELAEEAVTNRRALTKEDAYPMLSDITRVKNATKEARNRLSDKNAQFGTSAVAILIKSKTQQMMMNFFLLFTKTTIPTKMFTDRTKAKEWLEQYK